MKLKEFSPQTVSAGTRNQAAAMTIDTIAGTIRFNRKAVDLLNLTADTLKFHRDENEGEWYMEAVPAGGFEARPVKGADGVRIMNNSLIAQEIAGELPHMEGRSAQIRIANQATEFGDRKLYALLTASVKPK